MTHPTFSHISLPHSVQEEMKKTGVWKSTCPLPLSRLSLVQFAYHDFQNIIHYDGSLVVMDVVAPYVENIFRHLFLQQFPIHSARRMETFHGSDEASMKHNNSSAFNFRTIAGTERLSLHGYGTAIDVNPLQNPCLCPGDIFEEEGYGIATVWPSGGLAYLNRSNVRPGMVEPLQQLFADNGFREWGGTWNNKPDYHHFQVERRVTELLTVMTKEHGEIFFTAYAHGNYHLFPDEDMTKHYLKDPEKFMQAHLLQQSSN